MISSRDDEGVRMTLSAFAEEIGGHLPSADEKKAANQLRRILAAYSTGEAKIRLLAEPSRESVEITLTPGIAALLTELLRHIGRGDAVTLVPIGQMLTTQQAADILNVSRPFLISLLDKGAIPHQRVGRHRRIRAEDLFEYKRDRDRERSRALADFAAQDADSL